MKPTTAFLCLALSASLCLAQDNAAANNTPAGNPRNIHADQTKVIADKAVLLSDFRAMREGHERLQNAFNAGDKDSAAKEAAGLSGLRIDLKKDWRALKADKEALKNDAQPVLEADKALLKDAVAKLKADKASGNERLVMQESENVRKAVEKLKADYKEIFGPVKMHRHGMRGEHGFSQGFWHEGKDGGKGFMGFHKDMNCPCEKGAMKGLGPCEKRGKDADAPALPAQPDAGLPSAE